MFMHRSLQTADQIHGWITRHLPSGPVPSVYRPLNYVKMIAVTTAALGIISFVSLMSPYMLPIIHNRNMWAATSLITILLFTSGHMFNHIRKVPYISGDGKGGINYFSNGFSNQFGLETQIVAAICTCAKSLYKSLGIVGYFDSLKFQTVYSPSPPLRSVLKFLEYRIQRLSSLPYSRGAL